jgi:hypothetical protein
MVGLFFQQAIALFVLKSDAGFHMFKWLATLVSDFLDQSLVGATFFFDQDTVNKHWFFVNTVRRLYAPQGDDKRLFCCHSFLLSFSSSHACSCFII